MNQQKIGVIILAAGASTRLGEPKQLKVFNQKSLLQHTIDECNQLAFNKKLIVLGAYSDLILNATNLKSFQAVINQKWKQGMGSSLAFGVKQLLADHAVDHIMVVLVDQPFVNKGLFRELIKKHIEEGNRITASQYGEVKGVPAIFSKSLFEALCNLSGDKGARNIIKQYASGSVTFSLGKFDVDTSADFDRLNNSSL